LCPALWRNWQGTQELAHFVNLSTSATVSWMAVEPLKPIFQKRKLIFLLRRIKTGIDGMIFKTFSPKNSAKKLAFLSQNKAKF
jgi:hypothetical protein